MRVEEKYVVWFLLTGAFLLQIWVADAESRLKKQPNIAKLSHSTIQAMHKIIGDDQLRQASGLALKESIISPENQDENRSEQLKDNQVKKELEFIWYKPWTWFNR